MGVVVGEAAPRRTFAPGGKNHGITTCSFKDLEQATPNQQYQKSLKTTEQLLLPPPRRLRFHFHFVCLFVSRIMQKLVT